MKISFSSIFFVAPVGLMQPHLTLMESSSRY
jgi:hypothetical protein